MTLQKKIQRSVKKNLSFYLTGSILTAITVMLLVGAVTVSSSIYQCFDPYFAKTKIEDGEFVTESEISAGKLRELEKQYDVTIEKQQCLDFSYDDTRLRFFARTDKIDLVTVTDGQTEWPGDGESSASWEGKPLPYLPYAYRHPEYGKKMKEEAKRGGDLIASREIFAASEKAHPIREEEFIKIERIRGKLLLIGAKDDVLWETEKYIRRMEKRLGKREHTCEVESYIYEHATHFVFPEGMVKTILPVGGDLLTRVFAAGRKFPKECKAARIDIDRRITQAVNAWKTV